MAQYFNVHILSNGRSETRFGLSGQVNVVVEGETYVNERRVGVGRGGELEIIVDAGIFGSSGSHAHENMMS